MSASGPYDWIVPDWPVAGSVRALVTTRRGGSSTGAWGVPPDGGEGMNLGFGSGESPRVVERNRARLAALLPAEPRWLKQVHGSTVVDAEAVAEPVEADAAVAVTPGVVAAVLVADCLPVLVADRAGRAVAVAHAGWRGLAAGVLQNTVRRVRERIGDPCADVVAYLGPAIGPQKFEVGPEVLAAMGASLPRAAEAFAPRGNDKFLADLFALARQALSQVDVANVLGGDQCTASDPTRFYSYRRDRVTGRQAALIWLVA